MEMLITMTVMSILVTGLASALVIAGRSLPNSDSTLLNATVVHGRAMQLAGELQDAISITERSAQALEFTVADRDEDGEAETIRYAWSGTPGANLTRTCNGVAHNSFLTNVTQFSFGYTDQVKQVQINGSPTESPESILSGNDPPWPASYGLNFRYWAGQYFVLSLPDNVFTWRVTAVGVRAQRNEMNFGPPGTLRAELRACRSNNLPSASTLASGSMSVSLLSPTQAEWTIIPLAGCPTLVCGQALCVVFKGEGNYPNVNILHKPYDANLNNSWMVSTNDGDYNWRQVGGANLCFRIYGVLTYPGTAEIVEQRALIGVNATWQIGPDPSTRVEQGICLLNKPQVSGSP